MTHDITVLTISQCNVTGRLGGLLIIRSNFFFFFFFCTLSLSSFWTSRGHRCHPFSSPVLAFNFYRALGSAIPLLVDCSSSVANSRSRAFRKSICPQEKVPTNLHEYALGAGLELTKLTYTRLEDNLIRHRGDQGYYLVPSITCHHCLYCTWFDTCLLYTSRITHNKESQTRLRQHTALVVCETELHPHTNATAAAPPSSKPPQAHHTSTTAAAQQKTAAEAVVT